MALISPARADWYDKATSGKIKGYGLVLAPGGAPGNFDLRIEMEGQSSLCNGTGDPYYRSFVFVNESQPNYKATLAMVMFVMAQNRSVTVYAALAPGGFCSLAYIVMN